MFRLVKVLNGNNQCEISKLDYSASDTIGPGCALICASGVATIASSTVMPDYISLTGNIDEARKKIDAMLVTEDMIFKVEYTGSTVPLIGMSVGISTSKNKMDSVTYNSSGKGRIVEIDDDQKMVYVKFRK